MQNPVCWSSTLCLHLAFVSTFVHEIAVDVMAASKQRHWESMGHLPVDEAVHWIIVDFLSRSEFIFKLITSELIIQLHINWLILSYIPFWVF